MTKAAEIYLALGIDKSPALRRIAACVACQFWMEMHWYGEIQPNCDDITRLMKRFRLGDFICAISVHYPIRKSHDQFTDRSLSDYHR